MKHKKIKHGGESQKNSLKKKYMKHENGIQNKTYSGEAVVGWLHKTKNLFASFWKFNMSFSHVAQR